MASGGDKEDSVMNFNLARELIAKKMCVKEELLLKKSESLMNLPQKSCMGTTLNNLENSVSRHEHNDDKKNISLEDTPIIPAPPYMSCDKTIPRPNMIVMDPEVLIPDEQVQKLRRKTRSNFFDTNCDFILPEGRIDKIPKEKVLKHINYFLDLIKKGSSDKQGKREQDTKDDTVENVEVTPPIENIDTETTKPLSNIKVAPLKKKIVSKYATKHTKKPEKTEKETDKTTNKTTVLEPKRVPIKNENRPSTDSKKTDSKDSKILFKKEEVTKEALVSELDEATLTTLKAINSIREAVLAAVIPSTQNPENAEESNASTNESTNVEIDETIKKAPKPKLRIKTKSSNKTGLKKSERDKPTIATRHIKKLKIATNISKTKDLEGSSTDVTKTMGKITKKLKKRAVSKVALRPTTRKEKKRKPESITDSGEHKLKVTTKTAKKFKKKSTVLEMKNRNDESAPSGTQKPIIKTLKKGKKKRGITTSKIQSNIPDMTKTLIETRGTHTTKGKTITSIVLNNNPEEVQRIKVADTYTQTSPDNKKFITSTLKMETVVVTDASGTKYNITNNEIKRKVYTIPTVRNETPSSLALKEQVIKHNPYKFLNYNKTIVNESNA